MTDKCKQCMLTSGDHRMDCSVSAAKYTQEQLAAENKFYLEKNLELVQDNRQLRNQLAEARQMDFKEAVEAEHRQLMTDNGLEEFCSWVELPQEPKNCEIVQIIRTARFKTYKPQSSQYKSGIRGRWQEFNGFGWSNCETPSFWRPAPKEPESWAINTN